MNGNVLIVEDDVELSRILQLDLKRNGFDVRACTTGIDGLKAFHDDNPDLVILDIALPTMDGLTVCRRIRETSNVPILMMTAHAVSEEEIAEGLNAGADEYMIKPLGKIEFHARGERFVTSHTGVRYTDKPQSISQVMKMNIFLLISNHAKCLLMVRKYD